MHHSAGMTQSSLTLPFPNVQLTSFALIDDVWVVQAESIGTVTACPKCLAVSTVRHRGGSELSDLIEQARGDPRRSVVSIDEDRKAAQPVFIYHVDHLG